MGHMTVVAPNLDELLEKARKVQALAVFETH